MPLLEIRNLNYVYSPGTPFAKHALKDINLTVEAGEFIGLVGHTGSGKSTLVQHLNGLIRPTSGEIIIDGKNYLDGKESLAPLRQKVGLVFQYPEYQLFEETILKDVAFGPENLGLSEDEVKERVYWALEKVSIDPKKMGDKSPFELSGGQMRRVAIAGILAMKPAVLVLDEPTAGLDPHGSYEILEEIRDIFETEDTTIFLVSHSMEEVARLATRMIVMDHGQVALDGPTREVFNQPKKLESVGLGVPQVRRVMEELKERGLPIEPNCLTVAEAKEELLRYLKEQHHA